MKKRDIVSLLATPTPFPKKNTLTEKQDGQTERFPRVELPYQSKGRFSIYEIMIQTKFKLNV